MNLCFEIDQSILQISCQLCYTYNQLLLEKLHFVFTVEVILEREEGFCFISSNRMTHGIFAQHCTVHRVTLY